VVTPIFAGHSDAQADVSHYQTADIAIHPISTRPRHDMSVFAGHIGEVVLSSVLLVVITATSDRAYWVHDFVRGRRGRSATSRSRTKPLTADDLAALVCFMTAGLGSLDTPPRPAGCSEGLSVSKR